MTPKIRIDVPMPMEYVTRELVREFAILAPFGRDNAKPVFADKNINIRRMLIMGKNRNVLKLAMETAQGYPVTGIYFGDVEAFLDYVREKFGEDEVNRALGGQTNKIQMSFVYFPKINSF